MANTTDNSQGNTHTTAADVRAAVENAGKSAKDESSTADDDDAGDGDDDADDDSAGDKAGSDDSAGNDDDSSDDADGDDEDEDDSDSDDDDAGNSDKSKSQSQYKYPQYAGDGKPETYISNLEKAHQNSVAEAVNMRTELNQANGRVEAVMRAVASNPELAKALNAAVNGGTGSGSDKDGGNGNSDGSASDIDNPFVNDLQSKWTQKSEQEINEFIEANPEVVSDPKIKEDVKYWMAVFSDQHYKRTKQLLSGGEAMAQAYKHLGLENKLDKQNLAAGAKKGAAPTRSRGKVKKSTGQKPTYTPAQIAMAKSMGKDETWLAKNAK